MGRFYKTDKSQVINWAYKGPYEAMFKIAEMKAKNKMAAPSITKIFDDNLQFETFPFDNWQKKANEVKDYYTSQVDDLTKGIQETGTISTENQQKITALQRELHQSYTQGKIANLQNPYLQTKKDYAELKKAKDYQRTRGNSWYNNQLESAKNAEFDPLTNEFDYTISGYTPAYDVNKHVKDLFPPSKVYETIEGYGKPIYDKETKRLKGFQNKLFPTGINYKYYMEKHSITAPGAALADAIGISLLSTDDYKADLAYRFRTEAKDGEDYETFATKIAINDGMRKAAEFLKRSNKLSRTAVSDDGNKALDIYQQKKQIDIFQQKKQIDKKSDFGKTATVLHHIPVAYQTNKDDLNRFKEDFIAKNIDIPESLLTWETRVKDAAKTEVAAKLLDKYDESVIDDIMTFDTYADENTRIVSLGGEAGSTEVRADSYREYVRWHEKDGEASEILDRGEFKSLLSTYSNAKDNLFSQIISAEIKEDILDYNSFGKKDKEAILDMSFNNSSLAKINGNDMKQLEVTTGTVNAKKTYNLSPKDLHTLLKENPEYIGEGSGVDFSASKLSSSFVFYPSPKFYKDYDITDGNLIRGNPIIIKNSEFLPTDNPEFFNELLANPKASLKNIGLKATNRQYDATIDLINSVPIAPKNLPITSVKIPIDEDTKFEVQPFIDLESQQKFVQVFSTELSKLSTEKAKKFNNFVGVRVGLEEGVITQQDIQEVSQATYFIKQLVDMKEKNNNTLTPKQQNSLTQYQEIETKFLTKLQDEKVMNFKIEDFNFTASEVSGLLNIK
jgi:hypothetical protein